MNKIAVGVTERAGDGDALALGRYSTKKANIQSPSHQAFDLVEMTLDEPMLEDLLAKRIPVFTGTGKALFTDSDEAVLHGCIGETLDRAAVALTQDRARRADPPRTEPTEPNGVVVRQLRPATHGLLLIYLLTPKDQALSPAEPPYVGLVFSFPSSHTARKLTYLANPVLIQQLRDGDYDDE